MTDQEKRFTILVCIDGSGASYQGLRYALKFSLDHPDTDISLLYVRPRISGSSEGLNMSVMRENMLDWDLDLPGLSSLKKARDILMENGFLGDDWEKDGIEKKSRGSRLGDHSLSYVCPKTGQHINLIVRESSSVLAGILDQAYAVTYDIVIVSATDRESSTGLGAIDNYTAISIATEHDGTVILARELEEGHGHLLCVTDSASSVVTALRDAAIAERCGCPIYLYAVAESNEKKAEAEQLIETVKEALDKAGYEVSGTSVEIGDPAGRIIENGRKHSLIVMSATEKSRLKRMFMGSISHEVLKKAKNSVMIIR